MTFATNQNRHVFVGQLGSTATHVTTLANAGDIAVGHIGTGNDLQIFFKYQNKKGEIIKSDYIPVKNLDYVKAFKAADLVTPLKVVEVTLDSDVNGGAPVTGQDYVLRIEFRQWVGISDKDTYFKDAAVHVTSTINDAKKLFDAMKDALDKAFSRELGATSTTNPYLTFTVSGSGSSAKLVITEKPQTFATGTQAQERVYFDVVPTTVYTGGEDLIWGKADDKTPAKYTWSTNKWIPNASLVVGTNAIGNGAQIADLEYFSLGERGDQYRNVGWPNVVITEGLADASKQYNVLELHFAFTDQGVNSYRSEKDITIAVPLSDTSGGGGATIYDDINDLIDEVEYHSGLTISGLSD